MKRPVTVREKLRKLMVDFGYRLEGRLLIQSGIRGFTADRIFRSGMRDEFDAAESLCPIVADSEYTKRLTQLTGAV